MMWKNSLRVEKLHAFDSNLQYRPVISTLMPVDDLTLQECNFKSKVWKLWSASGFVNMDVCALSQDGPIVLRDSVASCLPISYSSKLKRPVDVSITICVTSNQQ